MNINLFRAVGDLALSAKKRVTNEHVEFLAFYRQLVETLPSEMTEMFGTLDGIEVRLTGGGFQTYGIELTATDFIWWKSVIEGGNRFKNGTAWVQQSMLSRFSKKAEAHRLSPEERTTLLALLDADSKAVSP